MSIPEQASAWRSASVFSSGITAGSGSNRNRDKAPRSISRSPSDLDRIEQPAPILIVEDNAADLFLIREAIANARLTVNIHVARDGEQATTFFDEADENALAPCPALVILDINLPKKHGTDVLSHLRRSRRCGNALVIVVSTSNSARDRQEMLKFGADEYFHKPSDYDDFLKLGDSVKQLLARAAPPSTDPDEQ